ncbi:MAG: A/G-specific adenine glycosylase [Halocynthiibacter sp.]
MRSLLREHEIATSLLAWYDAHARELPWRVGPHAMETPDPYRIWLSEIMLQQTTVAAVTSYFQTFTENWPTLTDLADAPDEAVMAAWAGLGYYARARNLLKCARTIRDNFAGQFPEDHDALLALPGIGPYTAAAISSIAFGLKHTVMDGNVERVMARVFDEHVPLPKSKPILYEHAARCTSSARPGDYAQAVMDLGATICTPKSPKCDICPIHTLCTAQAAGTAASLPKKTPKKPKPTRHGLIYLARDAGGRFLLERRPDRGLLGGTLGWPTSDWSENPNDTPPFDGHWVTLNDSVKHTFTHFHLQLTVKTCQLTHPIAVAGRDWQILTPSELPTVMKKAYDLAKAMWQ